MNTAFKELDESSNVLEIDPVFRRDIKNALAQTPKRTTSGLIRLVQSRAPMIFGKPETRPNLEMWGSSLRLQLHTCLQEILGPGAYVSHKMREVGSGMIDLGSTMSQFRAIERNAHVLNVMRAYARGEGIERLVYQVHKWLEEWREIPVTNGEPMFTVVK